MTAILGFLLSPVGRWVGGSLAVLALVGGIYVKGRIDGRAAYKSKIERQIQDAVKKGTDARSDALRELDAGRVPNDWFRD